MEKAEGAEVSDLITGDAAIEIAKNDLKKHKIGYDESIPIRVEFKNDRYLVTFMMKSPDIQGPDGWVNLGPMAAATWLVDAKTGAILRKVSGEARWAKVFDTVPPATD